MTAFRKGTVRAYVLLGLLAGLSGALAFACGLSAAESAGFSDASSSADGSSGSLAACPSPTASSLADGLPCSAPDGTTCPATNCRGMFAVCDIGVWRFSAVNAPRPSCPATAPAFAEPCPPCWDPTVSCSYGCGDAETPVRARCLQPSAANRTPTWTLEALPCEVPDAGLDASSADATTDASDSDVQEGP